MDYREKIARLIDKVPKTLIDFDIPRERGRAPTQAFSEFLTNKEQGDWAEKLILTAINQLSANFVAVRYGKSDNRVAGEEGFEKFYEEYQDELDAIGKRPDLLIFKRSDYDADWNFDIGNFSNDLLDRIVPQAIAGLEIRSSSFLIDKYDAEMVRRNNKFTQIAMETKCRILEDYSDILTPNWIEFIENIRKDNLNIISFRTPSRKSSERLVELTKNFKILKDALNQIQKRDFLSITPKVEDLKVVYRWIRTYDVPHFYFQVFFDKVYGISYEHILALISDSANEGQKFFVESGDAKNQNKTTIKINSKAGREIAYKVDMPDHKSRMKELDRGRLLFHVTFKGGKAYLNVENLLEILNISEKTF